MAWQIEVSSTATKQLKRLDKVAKKRIVTFLRNKIEIANNPRLLGKALKGEKANLWRYRVGDYRLICEINDHLVTILVLAVGHRKKIYRQ